MGLVSSAAFLLAEKYAESQLLQGLARCAVVKDYGGGENTQTAAILQHCTETGLLDLSGIENEFNPEIAQLVEKVMEDLALPWQERKRRTLALAERCCQGIAMLLLADLIVSVQTWLREMPYTENAFDEYWFQEEASAKGHLSFMNALIGVFYENKRVLRNAEYPELLTSRAIRELGRLTFDFKEELNRLPFAWRKT